MMDKIIELKLFFNDSLLKLVVYEKGTELKNFYQEIKRIFRIEFEIKLPDGDDVEMTLIK